MSLTIVENQHHPGGFYVWDGEEAIYGPADRDVCELFTRTFRNPSGLETIKVNLQAMKADVDNVRNTDVAQYVNRLYYARILARATEIVSLAGEAVRAIDVASEAEAAEINAR